MKPEYLCPECRLSLKSQLKTCACGWKPPIKKTADANGTTAIANYRCQHTDQGQRCTRLGTTSPSTRQGMWYCSEHRWSTHGSPSTETLPYQATQPASRQTHTSTWASRIARVAPRHHPGEKS